MRFDVVVVGGGHAGVEAAYLASKKAASVLLVTPNLDLIAQMSCNPAIGGIAKGNIAREVDALGGVMGRAIDAAGIHFKMLNTSKGPAVWGNRAQADKKRYRSAVLSILVSRRNIEIFQGKVERIITAGGRASGVLLEGGIAIDAGSIVLCIGTFLNGLAHIGLESFPSGRAGEAPSTTLAESIKELGIRAGRLKTGTSPRIDGRTVDFANLSEQKGDDEPWPFSFSTYSPVINKASCWITRSTSTTHSIIRDNLDRSPLYTGKIQSRGPRYCPSIEDKVVRFGERESHNLFLEPEGLDTPEMYLNGLATSLPFDVQVRMVESIPGLEHARILRPGYGIEYDFFFPVQLKATLESKAVGNLFFAGQINGTSGYEEAACQGAVAGINAAQAIFGEPPLILGRDTSYSGVLIDDLVTKGTEEPYRMFTSRAEYRLILRQDNADERLMPLSNTLGFIGSEIYEERRKIWEEKKQVTEELAGKNISPEDLKNAGVEIETKQPLRALSLLKRPEVHFSHIETIIGERKISREIRLRIEADIKYSGFVENELAEIEQRKKTEEMLIPEAIDYSAVQGLLTESRQKLTQVRPQNLGQASRIPGVTPADITVLLVHLVHKSKAEPAWQT